MYLETKRLVLKPFEEKDDEALAAMLRSEEIGRTYMLPVFESHAQCQKLVRRFGELSRDDRHFVAGIYLENQLIGFVNDVEMTEKSVEMGYVIDPVHWNRGYATEALTGLIGYLHGRGGREIITGAFRENTASIRVMIKAGMTLMEKTDSIEYRGSVHECVYYVAK